MSLVQRGLLYKEASMQLTVAVSGVATTQDADRTSAPQVETGKVIVVAENKVAMVVRARVTTTTIHKINEGLVVHILIAVITVVTAGALLATHLVMRIVERVVMLKMVREMAKARMRGGRALTADATDLSMEDTEDADMEAAEDIATEKGEIDNPTNRTRVIQRGRMKAVHPRV